MYFIISFLIFKLYYLLVRIMKEKRFHETANNISLFYIKYTNYDTEIQNHIHRHIYIYIVHILNRIKLTKNKCVTT